MDDTPSSHELHHEIFGSILDRTEMTPYLLLPAKDYSTALKQAAKMMGNRGFDTVNNDELQASEQIRATQYIKQTYKYFFNWLFPFVKSQLIALCEIRGDNQALYRQCLITIGQFELTLNDPEFQYLTLEDPRHLFLLASSGKYPKVFHGYCGRQMGVPKHWQETACALLKMCHLIKSVEEDSQDINDFAQLGFFLAGENQSLDDLFIYDWENPRHIPESDSAQHAFVKISTFFHKLNESICHHKNHGYIVFDSGDGVRVKIIEIKARLKSPESMFTKLGKDLEGEAYDIRDILALTFILKDKNDTLKLFHALQKRGVILQENTASHSITQTLFDTPESMKEAVRKLMISLSRSAGRQEDPEEEELATQAQAFYAALSANAAKNEHSSQGHRKFQCKITFALPIHRATDTHEILIPGTPLYARRNQINKMTQQHTLGVEIRISDEQSWRTSEQKGESHHNAYKFRQILAVMNRIFKNRFYFTEENIAQLRQDQNQLFS
ncbi:MAG: hypothetical protein KGZ88_20965 [Methylomicrobium sp.]|nr:hypothetical protein [Methylomicrobium sp.]